MLVVGGIYSLTTKYDLSFAMNEMKYGYWYFLVLFYCYLFSYLSINNLNSYRGGDICHPNWSVNDNMKDFSTFGQLYAQIGSGFVERQPVYPIFPLFSDGILNKKILLT